MKLATGTVFTVMKQSSHIGSNLQVHITDKHLRGSPSGSDAGLGGHDEFLENGPRDIATLVFRFSWLASLPVSCYSHIELF